MNVADAARSQAIALAAVLECAILVDQLARTGAAPPEEMRALTDSLFRVEWDAVEDVFGGRIYFARFQFQSPRTCDDTQVSNIIFEQGVIQVRHDQTYFSRRTEEM